MKKSTHTDQIVLIRTLTWFCAACPLTQDIWRTPTDRHQVKQTTISATCQFILGHTMRKGIYGQSGKRRPWSDCAFAQSDPGFRCPLTHSLETKLTSGRQEVFWNSSVELVQCVSLFGSTYFVHVWQYILVFYRLQALLPFQPVRQKVPYSSAMRKGVVCACSNCKRSWCWIRRKLLLRTFENINTFYRSQWSCKRTAKTQIRVRMRSMIWPFAYYEILR